MRSTSLFFTFWSSSSTKLYSFCVFYFSLFFFLSFFLCHTLYFTKNVIFCSENVKYVLFKIYCASICGCSLWSVYRKKSINSIKIAYNNVFRRFVGLSRDTSISHIMALNNVKHFYVIHRLYVNSLINRLKNSRNTLIANIYNTNWFLTCNLFQHWCRIIY